MYAAILAEGRTEDVVAWINPRSLVSTWDQMTVTWAVAQVWQPWIDAFCDRRDQSPIEELEIRRGNFDS